MARTFAMTWRAYLRRLPVVRLPSFLGRHHATKLLTPSTPTIRIRRVLYRHRTPPKFPLMIIYCLTKASLAPAQPLASRAASLPCLTSIRESALSSLTAASALSALSFSSHEEYSPSFTRWITNSSQSESSFTRRATDSAAAIYTADFAVLPKCCSIRPLLSFS